MFLYLECYLALFLVQSESLLRMEGWGAYPLLIGITAAFYLNEMGVADSLAIGNALGMVIWATQTIFLILLGLFSLILMPKKYAADEKS